MKSKYRRTPYTTPGIKKIRYARGSIQYFNPLRFEEEMKDSFDQYWKQNKEITSGLGYTRNWEFFRQILTPNVWLFSEVSHFFKFNYLSFFTFFSSKKVLINLSNDCSTWKKSLID